MSEDWPPKGYTEPKEYIRNERFILLFTIFLGLVSFISALPSFVSAAEETANIYTANVADSPQSIGLITGIGTMIGLIIMLQIIWRLVVLIHEALHYIPSLLFGNNPDYGTQDGFIGKNPRVVPLCTHITLGENIASLAAPVFIIGLVSAVLMVSTSGIIAGVAGFVFAANTTASSQDMYHIFRLARMEPSALFANFETENGIKTEFTMPSSE
jgi:hypothetical protein